MDYRLITACLKKTNIVNGVITYYMISDTRGLIAFIDPKYIIGIFPNNPENWQTTIFKIKSDYTVKWKEESNYSEWSWQYGKYGIPLPKNIPQDFIHVSTDMSPPPTSLPFTTPNPISTNHTTMTETISVPEGNNINTTLLQSIQTLISNQNKLINTLIEILSKKIKPRFTESDVPEIEF